MGKGDKKSKKGKRYKGSFGVSRNKQAIKAKIKRASSKPVRVEEVEVPTKKKSTGRKKSEA